MCIHYRVWVYNELFILVSRIFQVYPGGSGVVRKENLMLVSAMLAEQDKCGFLTIFHLP